MRVLRCTAILSRAMIRPARNAGAIQLEVDGELVGSLGEEGLSVENQPVLAQADTAQGER